MSKVRVSIIVPVHNAEPYLGECLDSIVAQTEKSIEIICVDDGSTDSSASILDKYAKHDQRLRVLHQECRGAGAARNVGLAQAKGTYLSFLDADDFFEPEMLKEASDRMDATEADIVVFGSWVYDTKRKADRQARWNLRVENLPDKDPFSYLDMPDRIFDTLGNCVWNKLFRRSFVYEHNLMFQEISRANDLFFSCSSLVLAERITTIDRMFVHYRVSTGQSLQSTTDLDPLSFLDALFALKKFLVFKKIYERVEVSFLNHLVDAVSYNADSFHTPESLLTLQEAMATRLEPDFRIADRPNEEFEKRGQIQQYKDLLHCTLSDYLFRRSRALQGELDDVSWSLDGSEWRVWQLECQATEIESNLALSQQELAKSRQETQQLKDSSYRLGGKITSLARLVKQSLKG